MAEYIEREVLYKKLLELEALARDRVIDTPTTSPAYQRYSAQLAERVQVAHIVKNAPAADVALVVHSRFVNMGGFPACERCGASPGTVEPKPDNPGGFPPYCFACGSKMDKEAADGD